MPNTPLSCFFPSLPPSCSAPCILSALRSPSSFPSILLSTQCQPPRYFSTVLFLHPYPLPCSPQDHHPPCPIFRYRSLPSAPLLPYSRLRLKYRPPSSCLHTAVPASGSLLLFASASSAPVPRSAIPYSPRLFTFVSVLFSRRSPPGGPWVQVHVPRIPVRALTTVNKDVKISLNFWKFNKKFKNELILFLYFSVF